MIDDDATLAAYAARADRYLAAHTDAPSPDVLTWIDAFVGLLPAGGVVLELGSGPGTDAALLEARGLRVLRSDAAPVFADRLRAAGHDVLLLDLRTDPIPDGIDGVFANAVLLHLERESLPAALGRLRAALPVGGVIAFSLKRGDGAEWSDEKLGLPRRFTYWQEGPLRILLEEADFRVRTVTRSAGRAAEWLLVIAVAG